MVDGRRILTLVILFLSFVRGSFGESKSACSWGTWSPWNCTCCGNSRDQPAYRVQTQCCSGTVACGNLRIMAVTITSIRTDFYEMGQCSKVCPEKFKDHNSNSCSSVVPTMDQTLLQAKPDLCHGVCIGSLSSTVSSPPSRPQSSKTTVRHRSKTQVTASSAYVPAYTSHDLVPAKNVTTRPNVGSDRSLTTTKSSLLSRSLSPKTNVTHRDSTRSITANVRSSTNVPPYSSHNTVNDSHNTVNDSHNTTGSGKNHASKVTATSRLVLWTPVLLLFISIYC